MKSFPQNIKFKYEWRKYQKRVLDQLDFNLTDQHLHIVAPPGSGKTVLGLEVALRINKPTLIFAPTIAIRNQWIERFRELFLDIPEIPDWISKDVRNPSFLTVITYQSLHSAVTSYKEIIADQEQEEEDEEDSDSENVVNAKLFEQLVLTYQKIDLGTIILDEAHHLKNAWWKSLDHLKKSLNTTMVGLTATPPYDVTFQEWERYIDLNGSIDAEITVPELIQEGDLCPHQDLIHVTFPSRDEIQKIYDYRDKVRVVYEELFTDEALKSVLINHRFYKIPKLCLDEIYSNIEYYSAVLIYMNAIGFPLKEEHLEIVDAEKIEIPQITYLWMELLLTHLLFKDTFIITRNEEWILQMVERLRRAGVLEKQTLNFRYNPKINNYLSSSVNKIRSIEEIVKFEYAQLKDALRLVVLTDYIRKEYLNVGITQDKIMKIGVVPIFKKLVSNVDFSGHIGVLTGSLIILPKHLYPIIQERMCKVKKEDCQFSVVPEHEDYIQLLLHPGIRHFSVQVVTELFQEGKLQILIGTKSLLGEGWDAPSINALVLASFVGSYVTSNQMRGRAIRSMMSQPKKTSNVWHLLSIDPSESDGGEDFRILKKRFKTFVGINKEEGYIENSIGRMKLPMEWQEAAVFKFNRDSFERGLERNELHSQWLHAVEKGKILLEEIKIPFKSDEDYASIKRFHYKKTIKNMLFSFSAALMAFFLEFLWGLLRNLLEFGSIKNLLIFIYFSLGLGVLHFGRRTYRTFKIYIKYRDIAKDMHHIANVILLTLHKMRIIQTPIEQLTIHTELDETGVVYCHLKGGTTFERNVFIKSLQELIEPIKNPRYLIVRLSKLWKFIHQEDYHSIPDNIGRKKKNVVFFQEMWTRYVGDSSLIFTKNIEGRKKLLQARMMSLSSMFEEQTTVLNKWR